MAIRIRIYPQYGRRRSLATHNRLAQVQLRAQRQRAAMQLQYERALFAMKLNSVQMQTAAQYGAYGNYGAYAAPMYAAYGASFPAVGAVPFGYRYASVSPYGISAFGY